MSSSEIKAQCYYLRELPVLNNIMTVKLQAPSRYRTKENIVGGQMLIH